MAPEVIERKKHTYKMDIYSMGITFFELLEGKTPYDLAYSVKNILQMIKTNKVIYRYTTKYIQDIINKMIA